MGVAKSYIFRRQNDVIKISAHVKQACSIIHSRYAINVNRPFIGELFENEKHKMICLLSYLLLTLTVSCFASFWDTNIRNLLFFYELSHKRCNIYIY